MADQRRAIHAYLTPEAHDRWHDFAAEQGVSVSSMLEAIALDWKERLDHGADLRLELKELAEAANGIDAARRSRKRS